MITTREVDSLKAIDKYHIGIINYMSNNIYISLSNDLSLVISIDYDESIDEFSELADMFDLEIGLEDIYNSKAISNALTINSMMLHVLAQNENHKQVFNILRLYYTCFSEIPPLSFSSTDTGYCPHYDMLYTVELNKSGYTNLKFFEKLFQLQIVEEDKYDFLEKYYQLIAWYGGDDIHKHIKINLNEIKYITLQTKVRRLAYLKMILDMFTKSNYYPENIFNRKIEIEAEQYNNQLLSYTNSKGIIEKSKTGNSAKPYVGALLSLQLLYTQNNMYQVSKYGKIYNIIDGKLNNKNNNFFDLEPYQKSFFLFFILSNDELYFWVLLNIIYIENNETTYKKIKEVFQSYLLSELQEVIKNSSLSAKDKGKITTKIKRIKEWKNPERYLEHIIEPRINWLIDLDLLDKNAFQKNNISLSKKGLMLFDVLNSYYDIFLEKYLISGQLLCSDFFDMISELYEIDALPNNENNFNLIDNYINESFSLFKTLAPNRVTASQAILYTCFMMLFKEKKIVNFCTIKNYLSSKENTSFIFDWYKTENDGSIRRKK